MKLDQDFFAVWTPRLLGVLRIAVGLLFLQHGTAKLLGFPHVDMPTPPLVSMAGLAGVMELVGGVLMVLGLFTRPVAFVLSGEMAVAYFMAHAPKGFWPISNQGDLAVLFCFVFLYFSVAGAGAYSLDRTRASG
jgi:putative oxidoreductase